jgi:hypothetical protein
MYSGVEVGLASGTKTPISILIVPLGPLFVAADPA